MNIAFFGLGNMGFPVAANLLKAGHEVTSAAHRSKERVEKLVALGGKCAASPAEAAKDADIIFTIVPNDASLEELMVSPDMLEAVKDGVIIIDMTSATPGAVRKLEEFFAPKHARVLDAPVSGGIAGAAAGTMTMMCSGDRALFDEVMPVLQSISGKQYYVGAEVGQGKMIKALNNLVGAANLAVVAEMDRIVRKNNIDPDVVYEVLSAATATSFQFVNCYPRISKQDFRPTFTVALMKKDLGIAMGMAEGLNLPMVETTYEYYKQAEPYGSEDYSAIAKVDLKR